jgi:hypothetical protein
MAAKVCSNFIIAGPLGHILSESGVHQGDPFGSALFALGNHPCLIEIAQHHPEVLVTGYADKNFFLGPRQAGTKAIPDFQVILQEANLQLNTYSLLVNSEDVRLADQAQISQSGFHDEFLDHLDGGDTMPLAHKGLQILGCPGEFERDLDLLQDVQYVHQRI